MKTKLIQKIKEEYFKGQPTRDLLFKGEESPRAEFGYKVRRGNEIFTVVDWGNIWNFIEKSISQSKEELELINGDKIENTWGAGIKEGRRQCKEELVEEIKNLFDKYNEMDNNSIQFEIRIRKVKDFMTDLEDLNKK